MKNIKFTDYFFIINALKPLIEKYDIKQSDIDIFIQNNSYLDLTNKFDGWIYYLVKNYPNQTKELWSLESGLLQPYFTNLGIAYK